MAVGTARLVRYRLTVRPNYLKGITLINNRISDLRGDLRDPFQVPAEMAAEVSAPSSNGGEQADSLTVEVEASTTEEAAKEALWRALCTGAGLPASASDRVMWRLYTLGALDSAVIWLYEQGFFAPFAWPEEGVVLLLSSPLSEWSEMSAEEIADNAFFDAARHAAFQESGWTVVEVYPASSTLDEQLVRIVELVLGGEVDEAEEEATE